MGEGSSMLETVSQAAVPTRRMMMMTNKNIKTLNDLRKYLQKTVHPDLILVRGNGYYYFYSEDDELSKHLASIRCTSVYVFNWQQLTVEQWVMEARNKVFPILNEN
jgi:hypothetical protein